jgi:phosphate:Na+ symporter
MVYEMIFGTVGGLALFLYGMVQMSEGLKKIAGPKLKNVLGTITKNRIFGFLVGLGVTSIIQSSSATTVMVVGFVNANLLTLKQAISVIIGSNVGTTATAWLVSLCGLGEFKITAYALPAVAVGFGFQIFSGRRNIRDIGQILLGFGVLFLGIGFMKDAFNPLQGNEKVHTALVWFGHYPLLAILAGTALTVLVQSSSASVAMLQMLAALGIFGNDWDAVLVLVIPFILGDNIGTTITAQLAAFRTNLNSRRAAWAHTMFNVLGACVWFWFIPYIGKMVIALTPWELGPTTIAASMAIAHTTIKVLDTIIFLPMTGLLEKIVVWMIKEKPGDMEVRPVVLDEHLLNTPEIAFDQARCEITRMAKVARDGVNLAIDGLEKGDRRKLDLARKSEEAVDNFQYEITAYLAKLSTKVLSESLSAGLPVFLHTVNDLERIGDHAVNIAEIAERKIDQKLAFSEPAINEASLLKKEINQMFDCIITALENNNVAAARSAMTNESAINRMQVDFRRSHVQRMTERACSPEVGLIFIDLVDNVEKIGDHLTNIAQAVIGGLRWDGLDKNTLTGEYKAIA